MTDLSSITSSTTAFIANQTAKIGKVATDTSNSFSATLTRVQTTVGLKPKAGFTAGPTYEATTLTGQTKAAITKTVNTTVNAAKSVFNIK
ncbi:MAG: hypothetical protein KGK01_16150 [Bradyrhizobium sp.]|nr:hypothetical protein [Pseudomonadota bacterium]MDE2243898.1 hypothetical protein [Bradyrhizobium sp.]MDE2468522.1 hypothetical protein [Bradyrhizobium sp.]